MAAKHEGHVGESHPDRFKTMDGDGNPARADEAVFPIVSQRPDGTFVAIGTGFFIAEHGVFATAAHVVDEVLEDGVAVAPFGIFQMLSGDVVVIRPILTVTRHTVADVAIGQAAPMHHNTTGAPLRNPLLTLAAEVPPVGALVYTYAYPRSEIVAGAKQEVRFFPGFYEGSITHAYPGGRDETMLPGPCFETSMVIHGGASGGPVLNEHGRVVAVNSTGYQDEPVSFVSCIRSILPLALPSVVLPGETEPRAVSIEELCDRGFVVSL